MKPLFATEPKPVQTIDFVDVTPPPRLIAALVAQPLQVVSEQQIATLGAQNQNHAATMSAKILATVKASDADGFGTKLNELISTAKGLDPSKMKSGGIIGKISNLWGGAKEKMFAQYETVEKRMNTLVLEMDKTSGLMLKRVDDLEVMFTENYNAYLGFVQAVSDGEQLVELLKSQLASEQAATDTFAAQRQADIQEKIQRVEKRVDDFRRSITLCQLAAPEIRGMQSNSRTLAATFNDIKVTTIPAWQSVFSRYIVSLEQKKGAELANAVHDATDEAFRMQADQMRQNVVEIAKAKERSVVSIETLEHMQNQLIGAAEDAMRIANEGAAQRATAKVKLEAMEQQRIAALASHPQLTN